MGKDAEIRKGGLGATTSTSPNDYEYPRAPITETVSWDGPAGSDAGHSRNYNRNDRVSGGRRISFNNRNQEGRGVGDIFADDEAERNSNRIRRSGDSVNSSSNGLNLGALRISRCYLNSPLVLKYVRLGPLFHVRLIA